LTRVHYVLITVAIIIFDIWTKALILGRLRLHEAIEVIPGFFNLVYVRNTGAAFGIGAGAGSKLVPLLLTGGAIVVFLFVVVYAMKTPVSDRALQVGLHLIMGGAIGNLIDRFRFGYVVDFLDVYIGRHHWPAFNVADSAICIGIALLFLDMWKKPSESSAKTAPAESGR
jgi:signal peptidase II